MISSHYSKTNAGFQAWEGLYRGYSDWSSESVDRSKTTSMHLNMQLWGTAHLLQPQLRATG